MSAYAGANITNGGLVCAIDATNSKSLKGRTDTSNKIFSWDQWTVGAGSVGNYGQNGDGNSRLVDTNPFGIRDIVWDVSDQDAASDADGGWSTSNFTVDPTQMYRFSVWVRRNTIGNGSFYLGCHGKNSGGTTEGVLNRSTGASTTNPYFRAGAWWGSVGAWYLVVGHVWPAASGTGSAYTDTGIYDTGGTKVAASFDYVWKSTNVLSVHRSYLFYSTDITTNQQWYQPRVDLCDGNEPSIEDLLNDCGNTWDMTDANAATLGTATVSADGLVYDGIDNYTFLAASCMPSGNELTFEIWTDTTRAGTTASVIEAKTAGGIRTLNIHLPWSDNTVYFDSGNTVYDRISKASTAADFTGWNHWVFTKNAVAGTMKIYHNGILWHSGTGLTQTVGVTTSCVLGGYTNASHPHAGTVGLVRIYSKELVLAEVKQNFEATRSRYGI